MKIHSLPLVTAVVLAALQCSAAAQTGAPAPMPSASAAPAAKPGPRPMTPAEVRDSAAPTGDLRPEGQVTPQISVPLGKPFPTPPKPTSPAVRPATAASSGGINDAVARCEAQADEAARAKCRDSLARSGGSR